jgi:peroxiredoxin
VAPDFELEALGGTNFRLSEHIGTKVIVLNFFATWCAPCKLEMPELNRFAQEMRGKPFVLLGIDAEEQEEVVAAFVAQLGLEFPIAIDKSGEILKRYGVDSFPTTVFIGADGRIQLYQVGAILNAEVAFADLVAGNLDDIDAGRGMRTAQYLDAARDETYPGETAREGSSLTGRAARIAAMMDCPCGCTHKVSACTCATAKQIQGRLSAESFSSDDDAEVMRQLNKEFCMKGSDDPS